MTNSLENKNKKALIYIRTFSQISTQPVSVLGEDKFITPINLIT